MYCPQCGKEDKQQSKYCRACGGNLQLTLMAPATGWPDWLGRVLDKYIRYRDRKLADASKSYNQSKWLWLMLVGINVLLGLFASDRNGWVQALLFTFVFLIGAWDQITYQRLLARENSRKLDRRTVSPVADEPVALPSAPTTNELLPGVEMTTRQLELANSNPRSGDLS